MLAQNIPTEPTAVPSPPTRSNAANAPPLVGLAIDSEATLNNQERGKDWEYRVIAVNKAGEGVPSNTVAAVV